MVPLVMGLLGLVIVGFLLAPLWMGGGRASYPPEFIDHISREIEEEIRALRPYPEKQA